MHRASKLKLLVMSASLALMFTGAATTFADEHNRGHFDHGHDRGHFDRGHDRRHEIFDNRYHHGRYYPRRGEVFRVLPPGYHAFYHRGHPYFFAGGVWYARGPSGFVVTLPPPGLVVSVLPAFSTTVSIGGQPYYYADDTYYRWAPSLNAYEVVAPPPGADQAGAPPETPPAPSGEDFYIYPKNGQSQEQQSQDRYECHAWATGQTGFDPTKVGGGVPPDQTQAKGEQYRRAMGACLEARGYSVQ